MIERELAQPGAAWERTYSRVPQRRPDDVKAIVNFGEDWRAGASRRHGNGDPAAQRRR